MYDKKKKKLYTPDYTPYKAPEPMTMPDFNWGGSTYESSPSTPDYSGGGGDFGGGGSTGDY
jgi:hypothetical protein